MVDNMSTHRVITEVTIKIVLDVDKDCIEATYPSDAYDDEIEALITKWGEDTIYKFSGSDEVSVVSNYSEIEDISIKSKIV
jgi:hypothetical protein